MRCEDLVSAYLASLHGNFSCKPASNERLRVITPYLYPDHDRIEIFIKERPTSVTVSDLGETLRHLETMGMDALTNQKRLYQVQHITKGLHVDMRDGVLLKTGPKESVGELIFDVLAACKAVADLIYGSRSYEPATFDDELAKYMEDNQISFRRRVPIAGETGTTYKVPLQIAAQRGPALLAPISPKSVAGIRSQINAVFRMWSDINHGSWKLSLLNDELFEFREEDVQLLGRVSNLHRWSSRLDLIGVLKATPRT